MRIYLERRFTCTTLSETTVELLASLAQNDFPEGELTTVQTLLEESDLVKFARYQPSTAEMEDHDRTLDGFLERTKPAAETIVADDEEAVLVDDHEELEEVAQ